MHGLPLAYQILAKTRNEAAVDALIQLLSSDDPQTCEFSINALLHRREPRAAELIVHKWGQLTELERSKFKARKGWLLDAIRKSFEQGGDDQSHAIKIAGYLRLTEVFGELMVLAESAANGEVKTDATKAVIAIVAPLGSAARDDRDQPSQRGPVLARLNDSLKSFSNHRNPHLVDAFLMASTWGDGNLREILSRPSAERSLVCKRLAATRHPNAIDLLAGFIRRRKVTSSVLDIIKTRTDDAFRNALLNRIGTSISTPVQSNLREVGIPKCLASGRDLVDQIPQEQLAPLLITHSIAAKNALEIMHIVIRVLAKGGGGTVPASAYALSQCDVPEIDFWMRAAIPVADGNEEEIAADENAQLIQGLIELLDHQDAAIVKGVRRVLGPMHAEAMLPRMQSLRPRSQRRLGRVVMMIDLEAVQRVRDALRHPVLQKRLEAIAMADAMALVDLLSESFVRIARDDHQEARKKAAEVMGNASSEETMDLLEEMLALPESSVRDAATASVDRRLKSKSSTRPKAPGAQK